MITSAMVRVALYAGMNCLICSLRGATRSSPKGSRNMRQSKPIIPKGKPSQRKKREMGASAPKVIRRYGSTRRYTTKNCRTRRAAAMEAKSR